MHYAQCTIHRRAINTIEYSQFPYDMMHNKPDGSIADRFRTFERLSL